MSLPRPATQARAVRTAISHTSSSPFSGLVCGGFLSGHPCHGCTWAYVFPTRGLLSGEHIDLLHDETFASLSRLCASGLVGAAAAAPPCSAFSRARLLPGGPPPIRTISHPRGKDRLSPPQATELATSSLIHVRCRELLAVVAARGGLIWLENPTSSLLWLDSQVMAWCRTHTPFASTVAACAHSVPAHKSWTFMCNHDSISSVASTCTHPLGFHPALPDAPNCPIPELLGFSAGLRCLSLC